MYLLFISKWKILWHLSLYIAIMFIEEGEKKVKYVVDIAGKFVKVISVENTEQDQKYIINKRSTYLKYNL